MSHLIKFRIVRNILLGNDTDDISLVDNGCNIQELAAQFIRKADDDHGIKVACLLGKIEKAELCLVQKCFLLEKIPAGITRQTELRENDDRSIPGCRFPCKTYRLRNIVINITDFDLRACRRNSYKTVKHGKYLPECPICKL